MYSENLNIPVLAADFQGVHIRQTTDYMVNMVYPMCKRERLCVKIIELPHKFSGQALQAFHIHLIPDHLVPVQAVH